MAKKLETPCATTSEDKFGIITKQSEVYVWDDKVFASYKAARAAQLSGDLYRRIFKKMYPSYSEAQLKSIVETTKNNPRAYYFHPDQVLVVFIEMITEAVE